MHGIPRQIFLTSAFCPQPENYSSEQLTEMKESMLYKEPVEPAHWVGLKKSNDLLDYLRVGRDHQMPSLLFKYIYIPARRYG